MLIKCPECDLQVSDKAQFCPHCGFPFVKTINQVKRTKYKRLPNGFGQITKLNSNLRNPYRVMVSVGKNENGRPISKLLKPKSYFKTYSEAYEALLQYNKNPYSLDNKVTFKDLYTIWFNKYQEKGKSYSITKAVKQAYKYCEPLYDVPMINIKLPDLKYCIYDYSIVKDKKEYQSTVYVKRKIKFIFDNVFDYAVEYGIVPVNLSNNIKLKDLEEKELNSHIDFTDEEMSILWQNINDNIVKLMVIQCYMGWRPAELVELETNNVNINEKYIKGGKKTKNGKDRIVPIHSRIYDLITQEYVKALNRKDKYLFKLDPKKDNSYQFYKRRFNKVISKYQLNPMHKPHDCRVQFITMAKRYGVNEYVLKRIVGHSITDLTERVYTKRDYNQLVEEIEKIK